MSDNLNKLAMLVRQERDALLLSWRQQVCQLPSARNLELPVLNDHIPALLDELSLPLNPDPDRPFQKRWSRAVRPRMVCTTSGSIRYSGGRRGI